APEPSRDSERGPVDEERGPDDLDDDDLDDDRGAPSAPDDRGVASPAPLGIRAAPAARPQRTSKRDGRQPVDARDSGPLGGSSAPSTFSCDDAPALNRILDISRISYAGRS